MNYMRLKVELPKRAEPAQIVKLPLPWGSSSHLAREAASTANPEKPILDRAYSASSAAVGQVSQSDEVRQQRNSRHRHHPNAARLPLLHVSNRDLPILRLSSRTRGFPLFGANRALWRQRDPLM